MKQEVKLFPNHPTQILKIAKKEKVEILIPEAVSILF